MSNYCNIGLILISFYTPLLIITSLFSKAFVARRKPKQGGAKALKIKPKYFLFLGIGSIWLLSGIASLSIYLDGKWYHYLTYIFGETRLVSYHIPLGILTGFSLYFSVSKIYYPLLRKLLGRHANLGSVKASEGSEFLKLYRSNLVVFIMILTNFVEEFVWRGFYIKAFYDWSGSLSLAVIISSVIYGSYHFTFGIRDGFINGHNGTVYAFMFVLTKDLTVPFAIHATYNLLAVVYIRKMFMKLKYAQENKQLFYKHAAY